MMSSGHNSSGRYSGFLGFVSCVETADGIYEERIVERKHLGDLVNDTKRTNGSDQINSGITVTSKISVLADKFARENFHHIIYATYMGTKWRVTTVEPAYPRLILTLGDEYIECKK